MKNRKLMAKAVKRAKLLTLQENRAKYLYKSYHDFKKRQTLMAYNWANADDLHVVWKNLTTAEKEPYLQIDPTVGIAKRRWLALRRSEIEEFGDEEDLIQFEKAWKLWASEYVQKLEKLKSQDFELYEKYI